jgi:Porin subfamily
MSNAIASSASAPFTRALAAGFAALLFVSVYAPAVLAQTRSSIVTTPKAVPKLTPSPVAKAAPLTRQSTLCSVYGEGFVRIAGTDTCVKAGGYLRSDVGVNLGR